MELWPAQQRRDVTFEISRELKLLALVKGPVSIARQLAAALEVTEVPRRSPGRGPPYWKSPVLRRQVLGEEDEGGRRGSGAEDVT